MRDHVPTVKVLLANGADVEEPGPEGFRPLAVAIAEDKYEVAKALMEAGADVNVPAGADGLTPLMVAVAQNAPAEGAMFLPSSTRPLEIAKGLIERGADVNAKSKSGTTALMVAATHNNPPMIGLLIECRRRSEAKNNQGKTAAEVAELNKQWRPRRRSGCSPRRSRSRVPRRRPKAGREPRANDCRLVSSKCCDRCTSHGPCRGFVLWRARRLRSSGLASSANATTERDFTEENVIARRRKSSASGRRTAPSCSAIRSSTPISTSSIEKVKIVRGMEGYGWFANTIFHDKDNPKKQYAIDFWFKPDGKELKLMDIRVQKGPKQDGDGCNMVTRMPVAWWWLPVQEHPGDMEVTRAWHVMSAIHNYIADNKDEDGNIS